MNPVEYSIILPYFERPNQLKATLESYSGFYSGLPIEVLVIDDASSRSGRPVIPSNLGFRVTVLTIKSKDGINPCVPYNVGVRHAKGRVVILSSPETCHVRNMFQSEIWQGFDEQTYLLFPVFAVTDPEINRLITSAAGCLETVNALSAVRNMEDELTEPLGFRGYPYASSKGSWYCHPQHRTTGLNFLSALTKKSYEELEGFDERFRKGTGYDDLEFRDRLKRTHTFNYADELVGLHLEHEIVSNKPAHKQQINSNKKLYYLSKLFPRRKRHAWGMSKVEVIEYNP